jgi:release factor glutamine methyltransferase
MAEVPQARLVHDAERLAAALGLSYREARFEAEALLMRALRIDRARLIAHPELIERAAGDPTYRDALQRRLQGEPVAYILGCREFYGLELEVTPAVLIPRPETELLVDCALARLPASSHARVLDIGTGSGCIAVALARARPALHLVATDASLPALEVATRNAQRLGAGGIEFRHGPGYRPIAGEQFDLVLSNPPYIGEDDPHLHQGDLRFEPKQALTPGADGTALLRELAAGAPAVLHPGGWLLLEHGYDQAESVSTALEAAGFDAVFSAPDLAGHLRVTGGRRPG